MSRRLAVRRGGVGSARRRHQRWFEVGTSWLGTRHIVSFIYDRFGNRIRPGAFFRHSQIGFTIVINADMTQGRCRFTAAHELAHALLHSGSEGIIVSDKGRSGEQLEKFADAFAGESLMPEEGIRRALETLGYGPKLNDVEPVIHLQRMFNVSYITALVRLRQARPAEGQLCNTGRQGGQPQGSVTASLSSAGRTVIPGGWSRQLRKHASTDGSRSARRSRTARGPAQGIRDTAARNSSTSGHTRIRCCSCYPGSTARCRWRCIPSSPRRARRRSDS